jgi:hypothetical protein
MYVWRAPVLRWVATLLHGCLLFYALLFYALFAQPVGSGCLGPNFQWYAYSFVFVFVGEASALLSLSIVFRTGVRTG